MNGFENITFKGVQYAIIIRKDFHSDGIKFFTPNDFSQQLAYMQHGKGYKIKAHVHNVVERLVNYTQEVLFIRKGKLRVDFYDKDKKYWGSRILKDGDMILLIAGSHGFKFLKGTEMIEVKQGPYVGEKDKTKFKGIEEGSVKILL